VKLVFFYFYRSRTKIEKLFNFTAGQNIAKTITLLLNKLLIIFSSQLCDEHTFGEVKTKKPLVLTSAGPSHPAIRTTIMPPPTDLLKKLLRGKKAVSTAEIMVNNEE
jgi:hypothetical protein